MYFDWDMELNRATKAYGAYADGEFVGVLLADMKGEPKKYHSCWCSAYIRFFDWLRHLAAGEGVVSALLSALEADEQGKFPGYTKIWHGTSVKI